MSNLSRSINMLALSCVLALSASACSKLNRGDVTGSIAPTAKTDQEWRQLSDHWGKQYDAKPGDRVASLHYAAALRALGQRDQAAAVLQQAAARSPNDREVLGAYGRALADAGRLEEAMGILPRAHTPERPDWRIYSAQGVIADKMGEHKQAQEFYASALQLAPDQPAVLSNLGFSLALSKQLNAAETTLRKAVELPGADSRVRQNLVVVLGLQGKFSEAEKISLQDMPAAEAAQNIAFLKKTVAQPNAWEKIRSAQR